METNNHTSYKNPYIVGLIFNALSLAIYLMGKRQNDEFNFFSQTFFLNYALTIIYLILLLLSKSTHERPRPKISQGCWINVVILFTISAFSLNQEMNVFAAFPVWLNIYTLLSIPLFLIFPYFSKLPVILKGTILFLCGTSLTLSIYMFLYLIPLLPLSIIGLIAFGISIHSFVPAFWLWVLLDFLLRKTEKTKQKFLIIPGALIPIIFLVIYLNKWYNLQIEIRDTIAEQNIKLDHQLPDAIYLAQKLPADALTDEILVSAYKAQRFWGDGMGFSKEGANMYHSPLSTIALGLFGEIGLDESKVESILNIRKDYRHQTSEKLWTGISLSTSAISTNIQVFPKYRLAYHEKTFMIHNDPAKNNRDSWLRNQTQEALYTFHVPQGSIVTSLSLWINGKEQKSRLTTLQKADSAYTKIVGVERRDPAIVRWKEGNTIAVSVFPCTPGEDRKFKIGFTTPLKVENEMLCLENIWFEGPDFKHTREVTQVIMNENKPAIQTPDVFEKQANGNYLHQGDYLPYWQMKFNKENLSPNVFCFGGFRYQMEESKSIDVSANIKDVYLDISNQWTKEEFDVLLQKLQSKNLYAWLPEKTKITNNNKELVWEKTFKNQFSVPFIFDVIDLQSSLVITKTSYQSPVLSDLKQSDLSEKFTTYLTNNKYKLNVLNMGGELSPFWRSLRELRLISYENCSTDQAISKILKGKLSYFDEDSTKTVIHDSHLTITKTVLTDSLIKSSAPDHLLRIFAYNDLLRQIGKSYFEKEKYEDALFREAEEAYVVTPVTSMIVLESEEDYDRMGIHRNKDTVGNASVEGGGAVPEPHEWFLIALVAFFILRHFLKQKQLSLR